jgi:hypothetical protein
MEAELARLADLIKPLALSICGSKLSIKAQCVQGVIRAASIRSGPASSARKANAV